MRNTSFQSTRRFQQTIVRGQYAVQMDKGRCIQVVVSGEGLVDETCGHAREFRREHIVSTFVSTSKVGITLSVCS